MSNKPSWIGIAALLLVALAVVVIYGSRQSTNSGGADTGAGTALGQRTKTSGCAGSGGLPDRACTPGAILADATKEKVCVPGYSKNVRNVPDQVKTQAYDEYGIRSHQPSQYEVDHLISLELGGSNDISNLWPEPAGPRPGFHEKDHYENVAHDQVCRGEITIQEAQRRIAENWLKYWTEAGKP